jgi:REase_DpnII-MboI
VWINKSDMDSEATQRSRSFLFACLGAVVAGPLGASAIRFFENGVVSLNLPIADEVLRSRASRTTHPESLRLLSGLASLVLERPMGIENPYLYKTKSEIVKIVEDHGKGQLIGQSSSCAHAFFKSKAQGHCGTCSQCIDRRIAILAAGLGALDSSTDYESDVFVGPRKPGYEQAVAVDYARHVVELSTMSAEEMASKFSLEIGRAVAPMDKRRQAAEQLIDLHLRHGHAAYCVIEQQLAEHAGELVSGSLDPSSMLGMIASGVHKRDSLTRYAGRLRDLLSQGLPRAFQSNEPKNETHVQEVSDAILVGHGKELVREYPFLRWSSVLTKPDWSEPGLELLVECKYVAKREYIRRITDEIAADITKYGDSGQRVLFMVYDPNGFIVDEEEFGTGYARPVSSTLTVEEESESAHG